MNPDFSQLPLRDQHLPDPVAWWPPAPGWWGLLALLILLIGLIWWGLRLYRKRRLRRAAFAELKSVDILYRENGDKLEYARRLSVLLRRVALSFYPREEVAGLSGEAWLTFLDRAVHGGEGHGGFTRGPGRALIEAPYNPHCEVNVSGLSTLARQWLARATKGEGKRS